MADSDDDACGSRAKELGKLRSNSTSPSALSTASSGSPLVRGHSGSSAAGSRRPAPTSIAAAQLQCQQSRQLAEMASTASDTKREHSKKCTSGQAPSTARDHHKGLGYRLAKSAAFRAYRLNELWSVNKMRYMNLACLLMTLICLVAILLLANGRQPPQRHLAGEPEALSSAQPPPPPPQQHLPGARKFADEAESIDSLDSQPFVMAHDSPRAPSKWARSSASSGEREVEETTARPSSTTSTSTSTTTGKPTTTTSSQQTSAADPFSIEPILSRVFSEFELGPPSSLLDLLRRNSSKPLVRRTKNGATIIISASSSAQPLLNESASSVARFSSSPFFRFNARQLPFAADLGAALPFESRLSLSAPMSGGRFGGFFGGPLMDPFLVAAASPFGQQRARQSLFMGSGEPPFASPFGASMMTVAGAMPPPPGLLNMLLRAQQASDDASEPPEDGEPEEPDSTPPAPTQPLAKNDTNTSTNTSQQQAPHNSTSDSSEQVSAEGLLMGGSRVHLRARAPHHSAGSMLVFSAGPELGAVDPFMSAAFGPAAPGAGAPAGFMPAMLPQFVVLNNGAGLERDELRSNPISPVLRSLLGGLVGELASTGRVVRPAGNTPTAAAASNQTNERPASASGPAPAWAELNPDDDWMPAETSLLADEQVSKHLRAHHRNLDNPAELSFEPADFLASLDNLERQMMLRQPPLGPHTRSQSLSRLDSAAAAQAPSVAAFVGEPRTEQVAGSKPHHFRPLADSSIFLKPAVSERMDSVEQPQLGFIGRLLSELSRRPEHVITSGQQQPVARGFASRLSGPPASAELEEAAEETPASSDDVSVSASVFQPVAAPASKRVRVRIRPLASLHEPAPAGSEPRLIASERRSSTQQQADTPHYLSLHQQQQQQPPQRQPQQQVHLLTEHPFTSPGSPLFGFPAGFMEPAVSADRHQQQQQQSGSSRQQRSFTYHSNHELAGSAQPARQQVAGGGQPEGRSRGESAVLGRRLDDAPLSFTAAPIKL